jgi:hypothetical protein
MPQGRVAAAVLAVAGLALGAATFDWVGLLVAALVTVLAYVVDLVLSLSASRREVDDLVSRLDEAELACRQSQLVATATREELDIANTQAEALRARVGAPLGSLEEAAFLLGQLGGAARAALADQQRLADGADAVRWPVLRFVLGDDGSVAVVFDADAGAISRPLALLGPDGEAQINGLQVRAEDGVARASCLVGQLPTILQEEIKLYGATSPSGYYVTLSSLVAATFRGIDTTSMVGLARALDEAAQAINQSIASRGLQDV